MKRRAPAAPRTAPAPTPRSRASSAPSSCSRGRPPRCSSCRPCPPGDLGGLSCWRKSQSSLDTKSWRYPSLSSTSSVLKAAGVGQSSARGLSAARSRPDRDTDLRQLPRRGQGDPRRKQPRGNRTPRVPPTHGLEALAVVRCVRVDQGAVDQRPIDGAEHLVVPRRQVRLELRVLALRPSHWPGLRYVAGLLSRASGSPAPLPHASSRSEAEANLPRNPQGLP